MRKRQLQIGCWIVGGLMAVSVSAQERPPEPSIAGAVSQAQIEAWVRQLDDRSSAKRRQAAQQLFRAGQAAIAGLEQAAQGKSREASTRALELLENHFKRGRPRSKDAARRALQRIAVGKNRRAANRAKSLLNPEPPPPPPPRLAGQAVPGLPRPLQIRMQNFGVARTIRSRIVNGVKEVHVSERNGRKIKIKDDPAKGIQVDITESQDGKKQTKTYQAKDAAKLKQQHPQAHKLYQQYAAGRLRQIQGFGVPRGFPGFPLPIRGQRGMFPNPRVNRQVAQELEQLNKSLKELSQRLEQATREQDLEVLRDQIRKELKKLEENRKQLDRSRSRLVPE